MQLQPFDLTKDLACKLLYIGLVRLLLILFIFPCFAVSGQVDCSAAVACTLARCERIWNIGKSDQWERVKIDEEKMKKWVAAHSVKERVVAEFLSQHYRFVRVPELLEKFHLAMSRAISKIGTEDVSIVWTGLKILGKSGDWMASYLLEAFPQFDRTKFFYSEQYKTDRDVVENLSSFIFIDDASYTGAQMSHDIKALRKIRPNAKVTAVAAFMTNQAIDELQHVGVKNIFFGELTPTISEIMKAQPNYEKLRRTFMRMYLSKDRLNATLTFFEHKVADSISFSPAFSEGQVFDMVGVGRNRLKSKVRFIRKPKAPFYFDTAP